MKVPIPVDEKVLEIPEIPEIPVVEVAPREFKAHPTAKWIFKTILLVHLILKVLCIVWTVTDLELRSRGLFLCVLISAIYIASVGNIWLYYLSRYRLHLTLVRYRPLSFVKSKFLFLCLFVRLYLMEIKLQLQDNFCFIAPTLVLQRFSFTVILQMIVAFVLLALDTITILFLNFFEVWNFKPTCEKVAPISSDEELKDGLLRIVESRAFCIKIRNIGEQPVQCRLHITRHHFHKDDIVNVRLNLAEELDPGRELTIVPFTHSRPGTVSISNFRSFGTDSGVIETTLSIGKARHYSCRRVEKFMIVPYKVVVEKTKE